MAKDPIAKRLKLNHFKVYKQYELTGPEEVSLRGQFDRKPVRAKLQQMDYFANPVRKNRARIWDKNAHLGFYQLHGPSEPKRVVVIRNQFGLQKLILGRPVYLLVPSEKIEKGSAFPKNLDHYKAYDVLEGQAIFEKVRLADQIDKQEKISVEKPRLFCVPVRKVHGKKKFGVRKRKAHLTFYDITPKIYKVPKRGKDQFGKHKLLLATSVFLGVPTIKLDWDQLG